MTDKTYVPSEAAIQRLMGKDKRVLAIAYLRAKKRADQMTVSLDLVLALVAAKDNMSKGKFDEAVKDLQGGIKKFRTYKQTGEGN